MCTLQGLLHNTYLWLVQCHTSFYDILNIDVELLTCFLKDTNLPLRHTTHLYAHTHRHESNRYFAYLIMLHKSVGTSAFALSEQPGWSSYDVNTAEWKLGSAKIVALMRWFWCIQQPLKWFGWGNHVKNKEKLPCETSVMGSWTGFAQGSEKVTVTVTHTSVRNSVRRMLGVGHLCVVFLWKISPLFLLHLLIRLLEAWPGVVLSVKTIRACYGTSDVKPYNLKWMIHKPLIQQMWLHLYGMSKLDTSVTCRRILQRYLCPFCHANHCLKL